MCSVLGTIYKITFTSRQSNGTQLEQQCYCNMAFDNFAKFLVEWPTLLIGWKVVTCECLVQTYCSSSFEVCTYVSMIQLNCESFKNLMFMKHKIHLSISHFLELCFTISFLIFFLLNQPCDLWEMNDFHPLCDHHSSFLVYSMRRQAIVTFLQRRCLMGRTLLSLPLIRRAPDP